MQSSVLTHEGLVSLGLELARYNELVGEIYEGALDPKLMARALKSFLKLYDANFATLILRVPEQTDTGVMILAGDIEGAGDVCYMTYPQTSTPFANQPLDHVFTVDDIMSSTEWEQNVYFKMFCGPHDVYHLMGADISTPDGGKLRFRVTRPKHKPNFSANERALCASFLPHLRRASQLHNLIDRSESLSDLYSQAISRLSVATLVLDESGSVLQSNPVADEILARSDGLKLVGGRLEATYPSDNRVLQQLIRSAFDPDAPKSAEAMSVTRPSGLVNLGVVVESIPSLDWAEEKGQPAALVYIRDASSKSLASEVVTKQLFNLTRAETALAMELANGLSLEEAAEALNIRRNTARAHLRSIFSKTGVRRQTELVRIMLNSVVALGKPKPTMKVAEKIKVPPPRLSAPLYNHA
ncbi:MULTISPECIES: helix-turn-helix transcriptional regulator [Pseudomonas]|jgi:DNA-binding CsgD family transcriptional regulator/PAS domain-containing protein|uniref:helix-turn-helix transcriptional regulator n=1 Tax=Pseudomonas TaxID=286 RepID=UPI001296C17B|nr:MULTISPECIES: helix-turn-helix transcriptional regulator [Pseudomonas]MCU1756683.1 helix-turn-helix transcriptional regulator [Pseudomonas helleri]MQT50379.1 helix-turn-helix transcriptional regulator [Pseudomonas sp. FSL R10-2398]MQT99915.1 helix-turn-helix transcriptional regulator [Pseudomonas sp. FSL R10-2245]MQU13062.1 helix-turn-helix transcriptional regulator [Pseudomonas sp. FSL R10-2189]MQU37541.1 helix-turn-helix transcriptional regulator [Pseudomonas sp. FSL R10-2172]